MVTPQISVLVGIITCDARATMLQQSLLRLYLILTATVIVLMVCLYWWQESEVDKVPYYNPSGNQQSEFVRGVHKCTLPSIIGRC